MTGIRILILSRYSGNRLAKQQDTGAGTMHSTA